MKPTLLSLLSILFCYQLHATHVLGQQIGYKYLADSTFEVTAEMVISCSGPSGPVGLPTVLNITYFCEDSSTVNTISLDLIQTREINFFCEDSLGLTTCPPNGSWTTGIFGVRKLVFRDTVDFALYGACSQGKLIMFQCCLAVGNNYIAQPGSVAECDFYPGRSNSSSFPLSDDLPFRTNNGEPYEISLAMADADGDSLAYYFDTTVTNFSPITGYSYITYNPFGGGTALAPVPGVSLDAVSGIMSWSPVIQASFTHEANIFTWRVEEWDPVADTFKGSHLINMVSFVYENGSNINPQFDSAWTSAQQFYASDEMVISSCVGDTFELWLAVSDSNAADSLKATILYDSTLFNIEVSVQPNTNPAQILIKGQALVQSDYGINFNVKITDDVCPFQGYTVVTVRVRSGCEAQSNTSACEGAWTSFDFGADSTVWSVLSGDSIVVGTNFHCLGAGCSQAEVSIQQTTTYAVAHLIAGYWYHDTFTVVAKEYPDVSLSFDSKPCIGQEFTLNMQVLNATNFDVSWLDSNGILYNDSLAVVDGLSSTPGVFSVGYVVSMGNGCVLTDTLNLVIHNLPDATILSTGPYSDTLSQVQLIGVGSYSEEIWGPIGFAASPDSSGLLKPNLISAPDTIGVYRWVSDSGCVHSDTVHLVITDDTLVGLHLLQSSRTMVFPNPTLDDIWLSSEEGHIQSVFLFNTDGTLLRKWEENESSSRHISLHEYANGTYLVVIQYDTHREVVPVVKQ